MASRTTSTSMPSASEATPSQWPPTKSTYLHKTLLLMTFVPLFFFWGSVWAPLWTFTGFNTLQVFLQSKQSNHLHPSKRLPQSFARLSTRKCNLELHCPQGCQSLKASESCSEGTWSPWNTCAGFYEEEVKRLGLPKFLVAVISLLYGRNMGRKPWAWTLMFL